MKGRSGQIRIIEVFAAVALLLAAFSISQYFTVPPNPRTVRSKSDLELIGYNALASVARDGGFDQLLSQQDTYWKSQLKVTLNNIIPNGIIFKLKVYRAQATDEFANLYLIAVISNTDSVISILRPDSPGYYQKFEQIVGGMPTHWNATSDQSDYTYISTKGGLQESEIEGLQNPNTQDSKVVSVTIHCRANATGAGPTEKIAFVDRLGTTDRTTGDVTVIRNSWNEYSSEALTQAPDGSSWSWMKVADLQAGVKVTSLQGGETLSISEIWIVVDYESSIFTQIGEVGQTTYVYTLKDLTTYVFELNIAKLGSV